MNKGMALMALNFAQKEADPLAYEPEFVTQIKRREQARKEAEEIRKMPKKDPLFDFDDSVDKLSEVSEKYAVDKELRREFESVTKSEKAPVVETPVLMKPPTA